MKSPRYSKNRPFRLGIASLLLAGLSLVLLIAPSADAARNQREELDLTIIERQRELTPQMDRAQRIQLLRIEEAIDQARSDLRSGQFMVDAKPSAMQPKRDVKPIQEEGKRIFAAAEAALYDNQKALIELLQSVDERTKNTRSEDETVAKLELATVNYSEALELACEKVMQASWGKGYEALFFHEVFIHTPDEVRMGGSALRNEAYDVLVAIDGTNFTLTLPVDFKLEAATAGDEASVFAYENAAAFERSKQALLAIEVIIPEGSGSGLLFVRAIDMATQRIVAAELLKIPDISNFNEGAAAEQLPDQTPQRAELLGGARNIQQATSLAEPYHFELQPDVESRPTEALITQLIFENSELLLVDSQFIKAAYGTVLDEPENWQGMADGRILLGAGDAEDSFELALQVFDSERALPAGTLTLGSEAAE